MYRCILFLTLICSTLIQWRHGYSIGEVNSCNHSLVIALIGEPQLIRMDLITRDFYIFTPTTNLLTPVALTADQENGFVFFSDVYYEQIYRTNFKNGSDTVVIKDLPAGSYVNGIAVDPVLQKLFYTDYAFVGEPSDSYEIVYAAVRSMDYNGTNTVDILTENDTLLNPKAIIVDTNLRTIYYTDSGDPPHISAVAYNGSNHRVVLNMGLVIPNGIAEDFHNNRIFYCDAGTDTIGVINTDGTNNRIIYANNLAVFTHFFHIIRVNDSLFITNWDVETTTSPRKNIVLIEMNLDGSNARTAITTNTTGTVKTCGLIDICFPAEQQSELAYSDDVTFTQITTITSTEFIESDDKLGESSGDVESHADAIMIGMVLFAAILINIIVSSTICCLYKKRMRTLKTGVGNTSISHHDNMTFESDDYLTPVTRNIPSQYLTMVPDPSYLGSEYPTSPNLPVNNDTPDNIYEAIID